MDNNVRAEWVNALRSGDYNQIKGALKVIAPENPGNKDVYGESGYCCLGVLCDLAVKAGAIEPGVVKDDGHVEYEWGGIRESGVLPVPVRDWAGLNHGNPIVRFNGGTATLATINDTGHTFDKIADLIEEEL